MLWKVSVEILRGNELQHGVPQKLQSLVMAPATSYCCLATTAQCFDSMQHPHVRVFTLPRTHTGTIQPRCTKVATCNHSFGLILTVGTSKFATGLQKSGEVPCVAPHTCRNKPFTCQTFKAHAYTCTPILLTQPTYTHHYSHQPDTLSHHWIHIYHSILIGQLPW